MTEFALFQNVSGRKYEMNDKDFWVTQAGFIEGVCSQAVGFPVDVAALIDGEASDATVYCYQIMIRGKYERIYRAFWDWHLSSNSQFFNSPAEAAFYFAKAFARWKADIVEIESEQ